MGRLKPPLASSESRSQCPSGSTPAIGSVPSDKLNAASSWEPPPATFPVPRVSVPLLTELRPEMGGSVLTWAPTRPPPFPPTLRLLVPPLAPVTPDATDSEVGLPVLERGVTVGDTDSRPLPAALGLPPRPLLVGDPEPEPDVRPRAP
jgi:hypothetical protein